MRFANQAAITFATQALTQCLVVATQLVMPRIIPPNVKGPADLVMGLALPIIVYGNLGLASAILYHPKRKDFDVSTVASTVLTVALVWGSLLSGLLGLVLPAYYATRHGASVEMWHVALVLAAVPLQLATSYLNVTQVLAGKIIGFNVIQFLPTFLYVGTFFSLYLGLGAERFERNPTLFLSSMVGARVLQWTVSALVAVALVRKVARFEPKIHWTYLKEGIRFGMRPYLRDIFQVMTLTFGAYYLEAVGFSASDLGYFSVAATAMTALWQVPETIHLVLANRLVLQSDEDRSKFTPLVCRNMLFGTACVAVVVAAAGEAIFRFWAPKYMGSVPPLRILLVGSTVYCLFKVLQTDLLARGRANVVPFLAGLTFVLLAGSTVLSVSVFGQRTLVAAALCSSGAMTATGLATLAYYCILTGRRASQVVFLQREDLSMWMEFASKAWAWLTRRSTAIP